MQPLPEPNPAFTVGPTGAPLGRRRLLLALGLSAAIWIPHCQAAEASAPMGQELVFPKSVRLQYDIRGRASGFPYAANGELLWQNLGPSYKARLEIKIFLLGSAIQSSQGGLGAAGLAPLRFEDQRGSNAVSVNFARERAHAVFSANVPEVPLLPTAQDQLSVMVQMAAMLAGAPERFAPGTELGFQAIGPRSSEWWVFTVEGDQQLALPGGEMPTIKLTRAFRDDSDTKTELWLAPALGYLPAQIRLSQRNGDYVEQKWRATETP